MSGHSHASVPQSDLQVRSTEAERLLPREGVRAADAGPVYLGDTGAVFKRRLYGLTTTVVVPFESFTGVAVRFEPEGGVVHIELIHPAPAMNVPLDTVYDLDQAARLWRRWSQTLALPMMMFESDGSLIRAPLEDRPDDVRPPAPRRFGRQTTRRRPRSVWTRGRFTPASSAVHTEEREIIARD